MSKSAVDEAFDNYLENVGEDAADDLIGLAEDAFTAGWNARETHSTIKEWNGEPD